MLRWNILNVFCATRLPTILLLFHAHTSSVTWLTKIHLIAMVLMFILSLIPLLYAGTWHGQAVLPRLQNSGLPSHRRCRAWFTIRRLDHLWGYSLLRFVKTTFHFSASFFRACFGFVSPVADLLGLSNESYYVGRIRKHRVMVCFLAGIHWVS